MAKWLRDQNHEVFSVYDEAPGLDDESIVQKACLKNWILIKNDKDFSDKIYRDRRPHKGVVFLRLRNERAANKIAALHGLLKGHANSLAGRFVVVTETQVRFAQS